MTQFLADPLVRLVAAPFLFAAVLAGLIRLAGRAGAGRRAAGAAVAVTFAWLCALALGVPEFPPAADGSAIVYVVTAGLLIGTAFDLADGQTAVSEILAWGIGIAFPVVSAWWLAGAPPLIDTGTAPLVNAALIAGAWLVAELRLRRFAGDLRIGAVMMGMAAAGLGIVAWIAGAEVERGLGLGLAAALAGLLAWNWPRARFAFGYALMLGGGAALFGTAQRLSTGPGELAPALVLLMFVFFADSVSSRLKRGSDAAWQAIHPLAIAALALLPVMLAAAAALIGKASAV
jgi:hypothetical protein